MNTPRVVPNGTQPSWSGDGTLIAFTTSRDGNAEVYTTTIDGSTQTRITKAISAGNTPRANRPRQPMIGPRKALKRPAAKGPAGNRLIDAPLIQPRLDAGTERSSKLVVAAIADEQGVGREQIELPTREQVHLRVRLGEAGNTGKERYVEKRVQRGPVPRGHIFRKAVGDQGESQAPRP